MSGAGSEIRSATVDFASATGRSLRGIVLKGITTGGAFGVIPVHNLTAVVFGPDQPVQHEPAADPDEQDQ